MNKLFKKIPCPLCKSKSFSVLYKSNLTKNDFSKKIIANEFKNSLSDYTKHGQIVKCKDCTLVYVNPVENIEAIISGYKDVVDEEYLSTEKYRKVLSQKHLSNIEKYKKSGKLLDVGCFGGFFLELAKKNYWKIYGIEPSSWAGKLATTRGTRILGRTIEDSKLPSNYFDAVTVWDVIEHLSNPVQMIKIVARILRPGGIIAIGTPDVESLMFKILRGHHPCFIRMHLVLFSRKTIKILLEQNGFRILDSYTYGRTYPLYYYIDRIETKIPIIKNLGFLKSNKYLREMPFTFNLSDEFTIIAEKI